MGNIRDNHIADELLALMVCLFLTQIAAGRIIYVDASVAEPNDGTSWNDAYKHLQDALAAADPCDQIWVAEGIYTPDSNSIVPDGTGDREATFQLLNGVALYGGFPSKGGAWADRDPNVYTTILSGDLAGNDLDVNDPCDLLTEPTRAENCYHVFFHPIGTDLDSTAVLDGFTITAGNANESHDSGGGAILNDKSSPVLTGCVFHANSTAGWGGAVCNRYSSNPNATDCTFIGNWAQAGGGISNYGDSCPTIANCTFSTNSALTSGGAMFNISSHPTVTDSRFTNNLAAWEGAGIFNGGSRPWIIRCAFKKNSARSGGAVLNRQACPTVFRCIFSGNSAYDGGAINNDEDSNTIIANCTLAGNSAHFGGGMYNSGSAPRVTNCTFSTNRVSGTGGGMCNVDSDVAVTHCIFTGDSAYSGGGIFSHDGGLNLNNCVFLDNVARLGSQIHISSITSSVRFCSIQGGQRSIYVDGSDSFIYWGPGNIDVDPMLTPDGHLRSGSSRVEATGAEGIMSARKED